MAWAQNVQDWWGYDLSTCANTSRGMVTQNFAQKLLPEDPIPLYTKFKNPDFHNNFDFRPPPCPAYINHKTIVLHTLIVL